MPKASPVMVSIMLNIGDDSGHAFPYNQAVGAAAARLGWDHLAALQTIAQLRSMPPGWELCLHPVRFWATRLPDPFSVLAAARSIVRYLRRRVLPCNRPIILFLEFFSFPHLMALALALPFVPRQCLHVWLLFRYEIHLQPTRGLYRRVSRWLDRLIGNRYKILSDSEPLARDLTLVLGRMPAVMPIPHARPAAEPVFPAWARSSERGNRIIVWWPGRAAAEKGLDRLRFLASSAHPAAASLCLVAARSTGLEAIPGGPLIYLVEDALSGARYAGWMQAADLVLLPYEAQAYGNRTSGIFVEAMVAGKPAAVTPGTWMASEAERLGAPALVVDWDRPDLPAYLAYLATDAGVKRQVEAVRAVYAERHSAAAYAAAMQALYSDG